ncbi:MAG: hypothetical protein PHG95_01975 [Patescibacteria group bacterium]|nr:hypothetical protein [Patescibacteria group bacterium]
MTRKILTYIALFIFSGFLAIIQFSLVSAWSSPWNNVNLVIAAIISAFLIFNRDQVWFLALASGWFLDVLGFHPFGVALLSLLSSAAVVYLVLENWLTNRSLYAFLLLTLIAVVVEALSYNFLLLIFGWSESAGKLFLLSDYFWKDLAATILISLVLVGLFFNLLALAGRRLKPFFLKRH